VLPKNVSRVNFSDTATPDKVLNVLEQAHQGVTA
jgi:hypothetical protein